MDFIFTNFILILEIAAPFVLLLVASRLTRFAMKKFPWRSQTNKRKDLGLCHACGYNLKGIDSYLCPECGIVRLRPAPKGTNRIAPGEVSKAREAAEVRL
jgi:predicted RNA-binding Zn-ribbon protein involved in translation (DUF1610 family)